MDIACKTVSGGFAISSTLLGISILWTSAEYTPNKEGKSSFLIDRVMIWAMSYFLYDFFAMYNVYLARHDATAMESSSMKPNGIDADAVLTKKANDNQVSPFNKNLRTGIGNDCDTSRETFTEDISGVSTNVIMNSRKR